MITLKLDKRLGTDLSRDSLPDSNLIVAVEEVDHEKFSQFEKIVNVFNDTGDKLISSIFTPLVERKQFHISIIATSGIPAPYDAWTIAKSNQVVIYFNLSQWENESLNNEGLAVIKHEATHVLLEPILLKPDPSNFTETLNYIVVNEGIAHMVGYPYDRNILLTKNKSKWDKAESCLDHAFELLASANTSEEEKMNILKTADTGAYWDKYGAISGMFRASYLLNNRGVESIISAIKKSSLDLIENL